MDYKYVCVERRDDVLVILFSRPGKRNALCLDMLGEVEDVLNDIGDARVLLISGQGCFCSGGDLEVICSGAGELEELVGSVQRCCLRLMSLPVPVVAAVEGHAVGAGLALVLASDMVVMAEDAVLNSGFIKLGLTPGCGSLFLASLVGRQRACEIFMLGRDISAGEAESLGIVNSVVPSGESLECALEMAGDLSERSPVALEGIKRLVSQACFGKAPENIQEHFDTERRLIVDAWNSSYVQERLEKHKK